jgi:hypothetical protein
VVLNGLELESENEKEEDQQRVEDEEEEEEELGVTTPKDNPAPSCRHSNSDLPPVTVLSSIFQVHNVVANKKEKLFQVGSGTKT